MTGSTADIIAIVIVAMISLAFMLSGVFYADSHPGWRGQARPGADASRGLEPPNPQYEAIVRAAYEGAVPAQREGAAALAQQEGVARAQSEGAVPAPRGEPEPAPHETRRG